MRRALAAGMVIAACLTPSCRRRLERPTSETSAAPGGASAASTETAIRLFKKLIGRDPGPAELEALRPLDYQSMVAAILASQQFDEEGFFNLHKDRLLLGREGIQDWVKRSYDDYCALKLELADRSAESRAGKSYWELVRYRERWIAVGELGINQCFFDTDVAALLAARKGAMDAGSEDDGKFRAAKSCLNELRYNLPMGVGDELTATDAFLAKLFAEMETLPEKRRHEGMLSTSSGESLFLELAQRKLFPDFAQWPNDATPLKAMKLELVKTDGKAQVVRELGTQGNQQCLFAAPDPARPPIAVAAPIGVPEQPVLFPAPQVAAQPSMAAAMQKADGTVFVKLRVPKELMGVHASPYWLSRHPSKPGNANLHRARLIYYSYFCVDLNPEVAAYAGTEVTGVDPGLTPFFDGTDGRVKSATSCFECHARVQPVANLFGLLSGGNRYASANAGKLSLLAERLWSQLVNTEGATNKPGGFYDGHTVQSGRGLETLADVLQSSPDVARCVVDGTWAALGGRDAPLSENERDAAVQAFTGAGQDGRFGALVAQLLTSNKRAADYYTGKTADLKAVEASEDDCPEALPDDLRGTTTKLLAKHCASCHNTTSFIEKSNESGDETPRARGEHLHELYCKVALGRMPPGGPRALEARARRQLACTLEALRDESARSGAIPEDFRGKTCKAAPLASGSMGPVHQVRERQ